MSQDARGHHPHLQGGLEGPTYAHHGCKLPMASWGWLVSLSFYHGDGVSWGYGETQARFTVF